MTNRFLGRDHAVGFDVHHQLVEVGTLFHTSRFDCVRNAAHRRERSVQHDAADHLARFVAELAHVARHITTALFDLDLHIELAACRQVSDHVAGVDDLDIVGQLDIGCRHNAFAFLAQRDRDFVAVVQLEDHTLQIQQQVDYVFLHAIDGGVLMDHPSDRDFGRGITDHRRQQHATQGVTERMAIATLERLHHDLGVMVAERLHGNNFRLE